MTLTVAVICKNEGKNIERCLKSIFDNLKHIPDAEVLVVDSFSTDDTIEIASRYPVKIIRLRENWLHSPAAGRYTAFLHASGTYTMCIDADMHLIDGFLQKGLEFIDSHPLVAGVTGIIKDTVLSTGEFECLNVDGLLSLNRKPLDVQTPGLLKSIPGAGLFRTRDVLRAGNFHPFLRAEEEYELCQRLRGMGCELWYLPYRIAEHHGYTGDGWDELRRRWKRGFMKGIGEMFSVSASSGFLAENMMRFRHHLMIGGYVILGPLFLILGYYYAVFPLSWAAGLLAMVAAFCAKKKNMQDGLRALLQKALIGICIFSMFFFRVPAPCTYPTDPILIDVTVH